MRNKVLCFGEVLWDAFGEEKKAGGAPMNVARHLAQQHVSVVFASRVGKDESGKGLINFLKENKLYTANLIQKDNTLPTCEVTVELDEKNQATYIIPEPVSWDNIQSDKNLLEEAKTATIVVFGSLASRGKTTRDTLLNMLEETPALKVFDVNLRAPHYTVADIETLAARANIIKMNEEEAELLIHGSNGLLREKMVEFQKKYHTQTICVTRGENGAIVWHNHEFFEHPGFSVEVADTVGAGDAFLATFIAGIIEKQPMQKILVDACAIGSFVASKRGANPVYVRDEITGIKESVQV
ncbi:hypothetical protein CKK33_19235 [Mucilaginibacter sp. MD40]|uniref:carbohydrate kinase family protein n=1 Tax=Mucilaginibacter sp. MD40 TaxID=2029590 RepID=UPI000BAC5D44|nr:carbohydrate kinase [Mucilaginibacter sp. MD40]PAW95520.1 hypothetical protein CKK33_19235 [Mucilaginibacter sp. MD40]